MNGNEGNDTIIAPSGAYVLRGQDGDDWLQSDRSSPDVLGVLYSREILQGGSGSDVLIGADGDDLLYGASRIMAEILAGAPSDRKYILGRGGEDTLWGGIADDVLIGDHLSDSPREAPWPSVLDTFAIMLNGKVANLGVAAADHLRGYGGNDVLAGGGGNDTLYGDDPSQSASMSGADTLYGDNGDDRLFGGHGNDRLYGGFQNDTLDGGPGRDMLKGGLGRDVLIGGAGSDTFVFDTLASSPGSIRDADIIRDFSREDWLYFGGLRIGGIVIDQPYWGFWAGKEIEQELVWRARRGFSPDDSPWAGYELRGGSTLVHVFGPQDRSPVMTINIIGRHDFDSWQSHNIWGFDGGGGGQ